MNDNTLIQAFLELMTQQGSTITLMMALLWLFVKGEIMPRRVVDEIIKETVKNLVNEIRDEIKALTDEQKNKTV